MGTPFSMYGFWDLVGFVINGPIYKKARDELLSHSCVLVARDSISMCCCLGLISCACLPCGFATFRLACVGSQFLNNNFPFIFKRFQKRTYDEYGLEW